MCKAFFLSAMNSDGKEGIASEKKCKDRVDLIKGAPAGLRLTPYH